MSFFDSTRSIGVDLDNEALERFSKFAEILARRNEEMNLVADATREIVETRHFLDSLALVAALREKQPDRHPFSLVDVGSGAGFPGLAAAIAMPYAKVTLLDSLAKRCAFLSETAAQLGLINVTVLNARAEEAGRSELRAQFDAATSRAVAKLPMLCELCMPLVRTGGTFYAMKSRHAQDELRSAETAISKLGGSPARSFDYDLPAFPGEPDGIALSIFIVEKLFDTPSTYPRAFGAIKKRPL